MLSECKRVNDLAVNNAIDYLISLGLKLQLFRGITNQVLMYNDKPIVFKSDREVFDFLRPILKSCEDEEERLAHRERIKRELMIDSLDKVLEKYGHRVCTFSYEEIKHES